MNKITWFGIGFLLATVLFINGIELIHLTLETTGKKDFCGFLIEGVDAITGQKRRGIDITHKVKIVYKFFAWPMKTVWVYFAHHPHGKIEEFTVKDDRHPHWYIGKFESVYK